jgi:hypothetical protein
VSLQLDALKQYAVSAPRTSNFELRTSDLIR